MSDNYIVDMTSDIIRNGHNLGTRNLIKDLSLETVSSFIRDYIDKFGEPKIVMGTLLWINNVGDNYLMSIYKNEKPFDIKSLSDILQE